MSSYFPKEELAWSKAPVRGGVDMDKSVIWEGNFDMRSAFFRMPKGMSIPTHTHPKWVQVLVLEGEMAIESEEDGLIRITAGGCYFVEPGDSHKETATQDTLVLVTQGEDRKMIK